MQRARHPNPGPLPCLYYSQLGSSSTLTERAMILRRAGSQFRKRRLGCFPRTGCRLRGRNDSLLLLRGRGDVIHKSPMTK